MSLAAKLRRAAREPRTVVWERRDPQRLFERYGHLARAAGINRLYLVVSFDCDTLKDADVAVEVHERLMDLGVLASYAVPGEILERGVDAYRRIAGTGAEFLNHGHVEHTVLHDDGRYESTVFYDQIGDERVREDVLAGDDSVTAVVGRRPAGFRTPHFGTYQRPAQLRFLHSVLRELGYEYSSSTVPLWGFRRGPAFRDFGVLEMPVSGTATAPLEILDSWGCFAAPDRGRSAADYGREGQAVARLYKQAGAGILSFYADPSQVCDQAVFFDTVAHWRKLAEPTSYGELARMLRGGAASRAAA